MQTIAPHRGGCQGGGRLWSTEQRLRASFNDVCRCADVALATSLATIAGHDTELQLTGHGLTPAEVAEVAAGRPVAVAAAARGRMTQARAAIDRALAEGAPVYGLTTGLGARVV